MWTRNVTRCNQKLQQSNLRVYTLLCPALCVFLFPQTDLFVFFGWLVKDKCDTEGGSDSLSPSQKPSDVGVCGGRRCDRTTARLRDVMNRTSRCLLWCDRAHLELWCNISSNRSLRHNNETSPIGPSLLFQIIQTPFWKALTPRKVIVLSNMLST